MFSSPLPPRLLTHTLSQWEQWALLTLPHINNTVGLAHLRRKRMDVHYRESLQLVCIFSLSCFYEKLSVHSRWGDAQHLGDIKRAWVKAIASRFRNSWVCFLFFILLKPSICKHTYGNGGKGVFSKWCFPQLHLNMQGEWRRSSLRTEGR